MEEHSELQEKLANATPAVFKGFLYKLQSDAWAEGFAASEDPDPFNPYALLFGN